MSRLKSVDLKVHEGARTIFRTPKKGLSRCSLSIRCISSRSAFFMAVGLRYTAERGKRSSAHCRVTGSPARLGSTFSMRSGRLIS